MLADFQQNQVFQAQNCQHQSWSFYPCPLGRFYCSRSDYWRAWPPQRSTVYSERCSAGAWRNCIESICSCTWPILLHLRIFHPSERKYSNQSLQVDWILRSASLIRSSTLWTVFFWMLLKHVFYFSSWGQYKPDKHSFAKLTNPACHAWKNS